MDHKRQQIYSGVQEIRQLEQKVNQLRDEKVWMGFTQPTSLSPLSLPLSVLTAETAREVAGKAGAVGKEGGAGSYSSEQ